MVGIGHEEAERLVWVASLGALCGAVARDPGDDMALLDGMLNLLGAQGGFLGLRGADGECRVVDRGMDSARLAAACDGELEPPALASAAGDGPLRLLGPSVGAITLGGAVYDGPLLRISLAGPAASATIVFWFSGEGASRARSRAHLLEVVVEPVLDALRRLADGACEEPEAPQEVAALGAWSRCNVPLLFLREDGGIVAANPAAWRKLELFGDDPGLPGWLLEQVQSRLEGLRRVGGLPEGVSGDYAWVVAGDGDSQRRVGLAPVNGSGGGRQAAWLLSVEAGGPSTGQRVGAAADVFGLTARESDVLGALAEGLSNRLIAEAVGISEATVKFHLVSVMRKASTSNRTELLSVLYSLPV